MGMGIIITCRCARRLVFYRSLLNPEQTTTDSTNDRERYYCLRFVVVVVDRHIGNYSVLPFWTCCSSQTGAWHMGVVNGMFNFCDICINWFVPTELPAICSALFPCIRPLYWFFRHFRCVVNQTMAKTNMGGGGGV